MHKKITHSLTQNLITPVNNVLCVLDSLNEDLKGFRSSKKNEGLSKNLQILNSSMMRISALINDYRDLTAIQSGCFTIMN